MLCGTFIIGEQSEVTEIETLEASSFADKGNE